MTSRKRTMQPVAMTGMSIGCPVRPWMTSTAGAISEAPARRTRRQTEKRTSPASTGSAT